MSIEHMTLTLTGVWVCWYLKFKLHKNEQNNFHSNKLELNQPINSRYPFVQIGKGRRRGNRTNEKGFRLM